MKKLLIAVVLMITTLTATATPSIHSTGTKVEPIGLCTTTIDTLTGRQFIICT